MRVFDLIKQKLILRCENSNFPTSIRSIHTYNSRIFVVDSSESVHYCNYLYSENAIEVVAADAIPRLGANVDVLDYETVAGGDRFGNVFVLRLPANIYGLYPDL